MTKPDTETDNQTRVANYAAWGSEQEMIEMARAYAFDTVTSCADDEDPIEDAKHNMRVDQAHSSGSFSFAFWNEVMREIQDGQSRRSLVTCIRQGATSLMSLSRLPE